MLPVPRQLRLNSIMLFAFCVRGEFDIIDKSILVFDLFIYLCCLVALLASSQITLIKVVLN